MAILLKVKWVEQSNTSKPHQRVQHIGGVSRDLRWKHSHAEAIEFIERDVFSYCVEDNLRLSKLHIAQTDNGNKYLIVESGAGHEQLLLDLPPFPPKNAIP